MPRAAASATRKAAREPASRQAAALAGRIPVTPGTIRILHSSNAGLNAETGPPHQYPAAPPSGQGREPRFALAPHVTRREFRRQRPTLRPLRETNASASKLPQNSNGKVAILKRIAEDFLLTK